MKQKDLLSNAFLEYTNDQEPYISGVDPSASKEYYYPAFVPLLRKGVKIAWILQVLRWRIPKDISIVVGDSAFSNQVNPIQLTAMRMPYEKTAESCSSIV